MKLLGLRCDAPGCDFRDDTLPVEWDSVGLPCPKCGASLLTKEDMEIVDRVKEWEEATARFQKEHPILSNLFVRRYRISMNGTGMKGLRITRI